MLILLGLGKIIWWEAKITSIEYTHLATCCTKTVVVL